MITVMSTVNHVGIVATAVLVRLIALYALPLTGASVVLLCIWPRIINTTTTMSAKTMRPTAPAMSKSIA